jgi:hypothetical protein
MSQLCNKQDHSDDKPYKQLTAFSLPLLMGIYLIISVSLNEVVQ